MFYVNQLKALLPDWSADLEQEFIAQAKLICKQQSSLNRGLLYLYLYARDFVSMKSGNPALTITVKMDGETIVHRAIQIDQLEVLRGIVSLNRDKLSDTMRMVNTLLHYAAREGKLTAVKYLIEQEKNVSIATK